MIASMTGFARRELASPFGALVCELRGVNHRFLDATLRMPDSCRALEPELRQALSRSVKRGKIDCTVSLRGADVAAASLEIDQAALDRLVGRCVRSLAGALTQHSEVDLIELLRFPGVLRQDGDRLSSSCSGRCASHSVRRSAKLVSARAREGERLAALIEQRCRSLTEMIAAVREHLPGGARAPPAAALQRATG